MAEYGIIFSVIQMRLRKTKNLEKRRENCSELRLPYTLPTFNLNDVNSYRQYFDFKEIFGNSNPLVLEIGCGKGQFACTYAQRNPDKNVLAVECEAGVLVKACEKARDAGLSNIRFLEMKAEYLPIFIKPESICEIYLNFSTPFPKKTYEKHRLTHKNFLEIYKLLLQKDGFIAQKTDNQGLFEFSLESFSQNGFELYNISLDLHKSDFEDNIVTEYEQKFADRGMPIYRLEARLK